jgi:DNA excision repair protein ERCC-8
MFEGNLVRRLRRSNQRRVAKEMPEKGQRNVKDRVTALAWRAHDLELYSAHADGSIVAWKPRTEEEVELDEDEEAEKEEKEEKDNSKKRKRGVLEDIYQDLTTKKITFS